jgi:hypothetical protein
MVLTAVLTDRVFAQARLTEAHPDALTADRKPDSLFGLDTQAT